MDAIKNFAVVVVSTTYNASATSIVLTTGHAARLATAPFNLVWWNNTDYPGVWDDPNKEIVRVTAIASDTLTVTRGQEGITATTKSAAGKEYRMMQANTGALFAQLAAVDGNIGAATATTAAANDNTTKVSTTAYVQGELTAYADDVVTFTNKSFGAIASLTVTGTATVGAMTIGGESAGYLGVPLQSKSANYTLAISDVGKGILHPTSDNNARTFTIPANASVAIPVGAIIPIYNQINTVTIAITTDTLIFQPTAATGSRSMAANAKLVLEKMAATVWWCSGFNTT